MDRIMALDFGTKRVGIAVTDPNRIIATALTTIHPDKTIDFIKSYLGTETVTCFVIGEPKQMDYTPSQITAQIEAFIKRLRKAFPEIPVERIDERFSSKIATAALRESGLKKKDRQRKDLVDQASAVILLQCWMENNKR
jgi:putative Holliday junction resolvase